MIRKVVVAGGGVLGSQIAFQSAYCGFDVTIWLRSESSIGRTQPKLDHLHQVYIDTINLMATPDGQTPANWANGIADFDGFDPKKCLEKVEAAYKNTHLELDMAKAVADADLVIESMTENVEDKISFYQKLAPLMPAKTVLVTNSSTLLPSKFAKYTGRPDEYLSLHFANSIWKNNIAEIMAQKLHILTQRRLLSGRFSRNKGMPTNKAITEPSKRRPCTKAFVICAADKSAKKLP